MAFHTITVYAVDNLRGWNRPLSQFMYWIFTAANMIQLFTDDCALKIIMHTLVLLTKLHIGLLHTVHI